MHPSQLPLQLEVGLSSLQLAPELCTDAQVSRVQLSVDLLLMPRGGHGVAGGEVVSEAAFSTPRLPKPSQGQVKAAVAEAARDRLATGGAAEPWVSVPLEGLAGGGGAARVVPVYGLRAAQAIAMNLAVAQMSCNCEWSRDVSCTYDCT